MIVTAIPGAHPFDELATALADVATEGLGDLAAELRRDAHGLLRIGKRIMRDLEGDLVIVVDQFEELYSLVAEESVRSLFITSLIEATEDPHSRIRVVSTIRADFFDQPLLDDRLGPIVSGSTSRRRCRTQTRCSRASKVQPRHRVSASSPGSPIRS